MPDAPDLRTAAQALLDAIDANPVKPPGESIETFAPRLAAWIEQKDAAVLALRSNLAAEATEPPPDDELIIAADNWLTSLPRLYPDHPDGLVGEYSISPGLVQRLVHALRRSGSAPNPQGADEPSIIDHSLVADVQQGILADALQRIAKAAGVSIEGGYGDHKPFGVLIDDIVRKLGAPDEPDDDDLPTTAAVLASLEDIERFHDDPDAQTTAGVARLALIGYRDRYVDLLAEVERLRAAAPASEDDDLSVGRENRRDVLGLEPPVRAGSPPPTPAPTREQVRWAIKQSYMARQPFDYDHAADTVLALLSEPAPPLLRGTVTASGGGDVLIAVDRDTDTYPAEGTAVEVREAGRPAPPIVGEPPSGGGCGGRDLT